MEKKKLIWTIVKRFLLYGLAGFGLVSPLVISSCSIVNNTSADGNEIILSNEHKPDTTVVVYE